jgi:ABC-type thiamin/hydroxymethylpyrimidine transport system permease subunit
MWRFEYNDKSPADKVKPYVSKAVDVKGAITLAVFVTSFLIALTLVETGQDFDINNMAFSLTAGGACQAVFIVIEWRSKQLLVDLCLIVHKAILPTNLIITVVGFSMFMVFQTILVLTTMMSSIFSIGLAFYLKHRLAKMSIPNLST